MSIKIQGWTLLLMCTILIALLLAGCSVPPPPPPPPLVASDVAEHTMRQARDHVDVLQQLELQDAYPEEIHTASEKLIQAERFWQDGDIDAAYTAAEESLAASQRVLHQFYQQTVVQTAQATKAEIEHITSDDPDSPLTDFLPKLNDILDYSDELNAGQMVKIQKVVEDIEAIQQITENARNNLSATLESDISFALGEYQLSARGEKRIQEYCQKMLDQIAEIQSRYPEQVILVKIKVLGYTDQKDFRKGSPFIANLTEEAPQDIPSDPDERRHFLNQRLAEFRANTISQYIYTCIMQGFQEQTSIQIVQDIIGMGEAIPPGVPPPYPIPDPRRRICKLYSYITLADHVNAE